MAFVIAVKGPTEPAFTSDLLQQTVKRLLNFCSKSSVATIKELSLTTTGTLWCPEEKAIAALNVQTDRTVLWTDSALVLRWISGNSGSASFIASRVGRDTRSHFGRTTKTFAYCLQPSRFHFKRNNTLHSDYKHPVVEGCPMVISSAIIMAKPGFPIYHP